MQRQQRGKNQGSITKRPDGRWEARVTLSDGSRRSFYGRTEKDAHHKLVEALYARQNDDANVPSVCLSDFLDTWLERIARPRIRSQTFKSYEVNVRVHLKPALGRLRLDELGPSDIQDLIDQKVKAGMAPKSVRGSAPVPQIYQGEPIGGALHGRAHDGASARRSSWTALARCRSRDGLYPCQSSASAY